MTTSVFQAGVGDRMTTAGHAGASRIRLRTVRLVTGLILFFYVTSHLLNHSLGNISIAAMEAGMVVQKWIWQGVLGTAALYVALSTHYLLGLLRAASLRLDRTRGRASRSWSQYPVSADELSFRHANFPDDLRHRKGSSYIGIPSAFALMSTRAFSMAAIACWLMP
jgi:hypothetical protein